MPTMPMPSASEKVLPWKPAYGMVILLVNKTNERLHDPSTLLYTFSDQYIVDDIIREILGWLFFPVFII